MIALFTIFELEQLSDDQLDHLHNILSRLLIATEPNSPDRRNILATLENIEIVLGQKPIRKIGYEIGYTKIKTARKSWAYLSPDHLTKHGKTRATWYVKVWISPPFKVLCQYFTRSK